MQTDFLVISADAYASPWFHPSWTIFPQAIQDHFPKLLLISGAATAELSVTVSDSAFTFKFFFGYKSLLLPKKLQKKTIYGFTVNDLFIAKIQFISFCFHNLVSLLLLQLLQLLYNPYFPLISEITSSAFR